MACHLWLEGTNYIQMYFIIQFAKERKSASSAISSLWKGDAGEAHFSLDPLTRAESVLGTNLTEKLTEKKIDRQPPDVSTIHSL